jgi:hypothetical protein
VVPTCDVNDFQVRGGFAISRVPQVITSRPLAATEVRDQEQAQGGLKIREAGDVAVDPQKSKDEIDTLLPTNQVIFTIGDDAGFSIFFDFFLLCCNVGLVFTCVNIVLNNNWDLMTNFMFVLH